MNETILQNAANEARGLAMDAIAKCNSGHLGLPLGCAEIGAVLFSEFLKFDPSDPQWPNRDRFILSAGHGSMFLYAWLNISGYAVTVEDIKNFRMKGSITPGHPEFRETPGVEVTSGPLGQGIANAVGFALSEKMAEARFNTPEHKIFDHRIWCLAGDGCMQEGISSEAAALAGVWKLDNLVLLYDSNDVTLDAPAARTMASDTRKRFESLGWEVIVCPQGNDIIAVRKALRKAAKSKTQKPHLVIFKTTIAKGIPEVAGTSKGHGEGGAKFVEQAKKNLGLPEVGFYVSPETRKFFKKAVAKKVKLHKAWNAEFEAWKAASPDKAEILDACLTRRGAQNAEEVLSVIPEFPLDDKSATRASCGKILSTVAQKLPFIVTGSADLFGSTKNYLKDLGDFSAATPAGRNIWFGIREHAMGAITNGLAYCGLFEPSCATFLTFAGYMMGAIRVAALARLPLQYVFTHDSIGVGMDGPTHQPVEMVSILRCIPRLDVIRPADSEETAAAVAMSVSRKDGPTALILSRQNLPLITDVSAAQKREGTLKGAYVIKAETAPLAKIIIATGSEVAIALRAAHDEPATRVVSMPSMEVFERQSAEYREKILPQSCRNRIAIEAGVSRTWGKYASKTVSTDDFGFSADAPYLYEAFGINEQALKD